MGPVGGDYSGKVESLKQTLDSRPSEGSLQKKNANKADSVVRFIIPAPQKVNAEESQVKV